MMKISGRVTSCCVALLLALTCVSAVQRLNSINDLKKVNFGQTVPKHSLILLHWFANIVEVDNNNAIQLTAFDPNTDYGSHHYGNYERLLEQLPRGFRYFTVGNLNHGTSAQLPDYVVNPEREYEGDNRDRIIIRVCEQRIDQVYITQHYETSEHQGTTYDPAHTYQITINLLRQIREFSLRDNQMPLLSLRNRYGSNADNSDIIYTWGKLACLGLFLFIVIEEKHSSHQRNNRPKINNRPGNDNRPENNRSVHNNRPESNRSVHNNRPENNRSVHNYRPENNRSVHIYRPENNRSVHNYRPETNIIMEINDTPENRQCHCSRCALAIGCFILILVLVISLLIYFFTKPAW